MENNTHITVTINNGIKHIIAKSGYYLTTYLDTDNIGTFQATKQIYCKENDNFDNYHVITSVEYNAYMEALKNFRELMIREEQLKAENEEAEDILIINPSTNDLD